MARVFIGEDETILTEELSSHLENLGYTVCGRADTVENALELIGETEPDIVMMDVVLRGDRDAIEAAEAIHARWGIPVVFLTAHSDAERLERANPVYPFGYLLKPFGEREVKIAVAMALYAAEADRRRREAEEALRESESRFKMLYEQAPLGYQSLDENGNFIEVNKAWLETLGYSREEVIGKNFGDFLDPAYTEHFKVNFPRFKAVGEILGVEFEMVKKNGKRILTAFNGKISRDRDGNFKQTHCIFQDVTEQRQAEAEREKLSAQLRQAQKMEAIGTLAGGIAHDFNNILAAMIGYTELTMMDLPQDSLLTSNLANVMEAGKRAKELVRQILDFSRRGESSRKPFDLGPLAKEALKLLRSTLPSSIEIRQEIEPSRMTVQGDPTQIHQVLINLCSNAAQAMHEKGGLLSVTVSKVELDPVSAGMSEIPPGVYGLLKVSDTGQGMDRDTLGRIFEPFFTTKKTGEGTGMGLAVVYGIIKSHGGEIRVYSEENKGATFHVYLPLLSANGTVEEIDQSRALPGGTERILYIDDEPTLAELAKNALQRLGYQVASLTSSRAALEMFAHKPDDFDLVITDYVMPHPTGIDLAKSLSEIRANIPILLCTGFGYRIDGDSAAKAGIKKVLMKPLVLGEVARAIREVLDFRRGMGD